MYSYTFYFVSLICFAQLFSFEIPDEMFDKIALECMEKVNIDKTFVKNIIDEDLHITKGNPKINEQLECIAKAKNVVKEDGSFNRDILYSEVFNHLLPLINKTKDQDVIANKITDECIDIKNDNLGDQMINLHNCLIDAVKKY